MSLTKKSDFKGDINISQLSSTDADFVDLTAQIEKEYLRLLLGDDLYLLLIADLDAETPQSPQLSPYVELVDGENYDNGSLTFVYEGLLKMLRYFIYAEWKIIRLSEDAEIGTVQQKKDKSDQLVRYEVEKISNEAFNKGVDLYYDACTYISFHNEDFPTWFFTRIQKRSHFGVNSVS